MFYTNTCSPVKSSRTDVPSFSAAPFSPEAGRVEKLVDNAYEA